jgi:hypothetical protein
VSLKSDRITVLYMKTNFPFLSSRPVLFTTKNISHKSVEKKKKNKTILYPITLFFFPPENRAVYEVMRKNIVEPDRPQMVIWRLDVLCWIPKPTNTRTIMYYCLLDSSGSG